MDFCFFSFYGFSDFLSVYDFLFWMGNTLRTESAAITARDYAALPAF
jgi:hypothetical protein